MRSSLLESIRAGGRALSPLARLAWPIVIVNVLNVSALVVDTAMIGALPDPEVALTGLGFATQLVYLSTVFATGIGVGTVALIARAHGAADRGRAEHLLRQAIVLTLAVSTVVAITGFAACSWLLEAFGARGPALGAALDYSQPLLLGSALSYFTQLFAAAMRGVSHASWPLTVGLVSVAANVALDYGLIFGEWGLPRLGVEGAAHGTLLSKLLSAVWLGGLLMRGNIDGLRLVPRFVRIDWNALATLLRVGGPAALDYTLLNVAYLSVVVLLGHGNASAVAAHGIGMRVLVLAFIPALGISQATAALVGRSVGAGRVDQARSVVWAGLALSLIVMVPTAVVLVPGADSLLGGFGVTSGSELQAPALLWLRVIACMLPVLGVNIVFVGMMQGAGSTGTGLLLNVIGTLFVQLPVGAWSVFVLGLGPLGAWLSLLLGFVVRAALGGWVFHANRWLPSQSSQEENHANEKF